ncbi:TetR family transcriptional regulator [Streptomyces sp. NPDC001933]|uniref:acyl-CoA-like ligand-binding transcription factor n=1 Tax=Streptomyces sp. NPDC001933 TaxID=3364626 RepID=UPI0036AD74F0
MSSEKEPSDWRARKKAATRQAIQEQASRLFLEKGFDATTVEEIAAAAGVSHMTFFRYFRTKEDVAADDDYDPMIGELVAARPAGESVVQKIRQAFVTGLAQIYDTDRGALLARYRLILETPSLRARLWENQNLTQQHLVSVLSEASGRDKGDLGLQVVVAACLSAAATAIRVWAENDDSAELPELVDRAFAALEEGLGDAGF